MIPAKVVKCAAMARSASGTWAGMCVGERKRDELADGERDDPDDERLDEQARSEPRGRRAERLEDAVERGPFDGEQDEEQRDDEGDDEECHADDAGERRLLFAGARRREHGLALRERLGLAARRGVDGVGPAGGAGTGRRRRGLRMCRAGHWRRAGSCPVPGATLPDRPRARPAGGSSCPRPSPAPDRYCLGPTPSA